MILDAPVVRARQRDRGDARVRARGRHQARADGVGAGDLHRSRATACRRPASSCGRCAARWWRPRPARTWRSAPPGRTRSRCGRTSGSSPGRATATSSRRCASSRARSSSSACTCTSASTTPTRPSTSPTACASTCRCCSACRPTLRSGAPARPGWRRRARRSSAPSRGSGSRPHYEDWEDYERRIEFMIEAGVIEDYTYLWHDVRPHPMFGTVEIRVMDSQTHIEHSLGLAALVQAMVRELAEHYDAGKTLSPYPFEMLDENKWLAARHGLEGELVDLPSSDRVPTRALARRLLDRMREHCTGPGLAVRARGGRGPAGARQRSGASGRRVRGQPRSARGDGGDRGRHIGLTERRSRGGHHKAPQTRPGRFYNRIVSTGGPDLFVICKSCGSEVSPYITECPYCGNRLRKRAPKLDRDQRVAERKARRQPPPLLIAAARDEIPGIRGDTRPYATIVLVVAGLVGCLLVADEPRRLAGRPHRLRAARLGVVAPVHGRLHLRQRRLRDDHPGHGRPVRLAAGAPPRSASRSSRCSSSAAWAAWPRPRRSIPTRSCWAPRAARWRSCARGRRRTC